MALIYDSNDLKNVVQIGYIIRFRIFAFIEVQLMTLFRFWYLHQSESNIILLNDVFRILFSMKYTHIKSSLQDDTGIAKVSKADSFLTCT